MKTTNEILIEWLCEEYSLDEASQQINEARIQTDGNFYIIKYSNGVTDVVEITNNKVKHICQAHTTLYRIFILTNKKQKL